MLGLVWPLVFEAEAIAEPEPEPEPRLKRSSRHPWAWLLRRVFAVDVMSCPRCRGPMRLVKIANEPDAVARVLAEVGLGLRPAPRPRAAAPGQLKLEFGA